MKTNLEKKYQGTLEASRVNNPPRIEINKDLPICPEEFSKPMQELWYVIVSFLNVNGVWRASIYRHVVKYCQLSEMYDNLIKDIGERGAVVNVINGKRKTKGVNPSLIASEKVFRQLESIERQLGIGILNSEKINFIPIKNNPKGLLK